MASLETRQETEEATGRCTKEVKRSTVSVLTQRESLFQTQYVLATAELILTTESLLSRENESVANPRCRQLALEDLVGVHVIQIPAGHSSSACRLDVHVYKLVKKSAKKSTRRMDVLSVCFDAGETFKDNLAAASEWKRAIKLQSARRTLQVFENCDNMEGEKLINS